MTARRYLLVTADDFGIGPATSHGILDLARRGLVTSSVLMVTSPYAVDAVRAWRQAGEPLELGWHPCLTLDRPLLPAAKVPSLVDTSGHFWPLGSFLRRLFTGKIRSIDVEQELGAQYERFRQLVGAAPTVVNGHHHVHALPGVSDIVCKILSAQRPLPYLRRVREPWLTWPQVRGGRCKRAWLTIMGRGACRRQQRLGFPGNDWLAGVGRPIRSHDPRFFTRWLPRLRGTIVDFMCHPGYPDETLLGRDAPRPVEVERRFLELQRLQDPGFLDACQRAGFVLTAPRQLPGRAFPESEHEAA